ncbi:MAG: transcriptional regulator [Euryarchaeota archaeon]|nr:transcriptional regulator [Euryarchaeota archaeon]
MTHSLCDIMTCDTIVREYLPQIRAELVYRLVYNKGIPQSKVAQWMGLSRAAISQYISKKRGEGDIEISDDLNNIIEKWAEGIINGDGTITICDICQCMKKKGIQTE